MLFESFLRDAPDSDSGMPLLIYRSVRGNVIGNVGTHAEAFMLPRFVTVVPMMALLVGCASNPPGASLSKPSTASTIEAIAGTYGLVTIDGRGIPTAPAAQGGQTSSWPVVSGTLQVRSNGTFLMETSYETKAETAQTFSFAGSCFSVGNGFRMVWDGGGETALSARGDTLVVNKGGALYSYLRQ